MSTPDVRVRLSAEGVAEVVSALKSIEAQSGKTAKNAKGQWDALKGSLGGVQGVLGALGIAFTIGGVVSFIRNAKDSADAVGDLAKQVGAGVTELTALQAVAKTSGAGPEAVSAGLVKLNKSIDDLRGNVPAAVALFARIGLAAKDFDGKDAAQSFEIVAKAMSDRLPNAAAKSTVAMGLMGKSAAALVPTLDTVAHVGMAGVIEQGIKLGEVLTDLQVNQIQDFNDALDTIGIRAQISGARFIAGLSKPAIAAIEALNVGLGGSGNAMEKFGRFIGEIVGGVAATLGNLADIVVTTTDLIVKTIEININRAQIGLQTWGNVAGGLLTGGLDEAWSQFEIGNYRQKQLTKDFDKDIEASLNDMQRRIEERKRLVEESSASFIGPRNQTPEEAAQAAADAADREARTAAAKRDAAKTFADSQLALEKAYAKAAADQQKRDFDAGLLSVSAYYEARRAAVAKGAAAELAALGPARAAAGDEQDPAKRAAALDAIAKKAEAIRVGERADIAALNAEEIKATQALTDQRLALEQKVRDARGQTHAKAMADIEAEIQKAEQAIPSLGVSTQERSAAIAALRASLTDKLTFSEAQTRAETALSSLTADRDAIQSRVSAGLLAELSGNEQVAAMEKARLPILRQLAAESLAAARALGDPAAIAQAEAFQRSVLGIGAASDSVHNALLRLKAALIDSGARELANTLDEVGTNIKTVGQFFTALVSSMLGDLRRLSQEAISNKIFSLLSHIGGKKGRGSGLSSGVEMALSLGEFASGGPVYGPGTATSDSIPAWLSTGEYVVNARSVSSIGLPMLHAINRFGADAIRQAARLSVRPLPLAPREPGYAAGGLVGASAPSASGGASHLTVGLDDGLVLKSLETPEGQRVLVRALAKNRRALAGLAG